MTGVEGRRRKDEGVWFGSAFCCYPRTRDDDEDEDEWINSWEGWSLSPDCRDFYKSLDGPLAGIEVGEEGYFYRCFSMALLRTS